MQFLLRFNKLFSRIQEVKKSSSTRASKRLIPIAVPNSIAIAIVIAIPIVIVIATLSACSQEKQPQSNVPYHIDYPAGFDSIAVPANNPLTVKAVELGKRLFYDPILSLDSSISCSSCHLQQLAFADSLPVSPGVHGVTGERNSYSLANVGYQQALFMEGGVPSLELQVLAPLGESAEMNLLIPEAAARLQRDSTYTKLSREAYNRSPDAFVITSALAAFQRTMISGDSPFDRFLRKNEAKAISDEAKKGYALFKKSGCVACHSGFLLSDQGYHNIGLHARYDDPGRMRLTSKAEDEGKFKTPSLRNVALTAPYMHDGSIKTLAEVIAHFNKGGHEHTNKSPLIRPLALNDEEQIQLLSFLECLTDSTFINDLRYSNR